MSQDVTNEAERVNPDADESPARKRWHQRPSVRKLKQEAEECDRDLSRDWDEKENDETRLPASEAIHLGGFVFTEAFTPSTVSSLYKTLEQWPVERDSRKKELIDGLARSRGGRGGGWQSLGVVRPPGTFVLGMGYRDPDLPSGVEAVWLNVSYVTPSVAIVAATFTLSESAGDLSELLRADYRMEHFNVKLRVYGRWGRLRARIPWARPDRYGIGHDINHPEDAKRKAVEALVSRYEQACSDWFFARFQGRFAAAEERERPVIRLMLTTKEAPFAERNRWLRPVGLDFAHPLWRSDELKGWWLSEERWGLRGDRRMTTLAARRSDAAEDESEGETDESNWSLTQRIDRYGASLAARQALSALLRIYSARLAVLRDKAGVKRRLRRPVREGRELDNFLIRDGLDASTLTSDLKAFTKDLDFFRWGVPEFTEYRDHLGGKGKERPSLEYVPELCSAIRRRAARLAGDVIATTQNIKASAELRQAIANTRLQRFASTLAVVAVIVAVISLIAAK